ncbi:MAG TPA: hypothetical protein VFB63_34440 [Bryobacteraceae bacterium]|nr:hypothetical protein [Bryobacteraceae bacterium]
MRAGVKSLARRVASGAARARRRPFPRLVVHFIQRMARAGGDNTAGDLEVGAGPLLGLLAAPGAFQCFLSIDKYSSLLNWLRARPSEDLIVASIPDKLLFIAVSMSITGIVAVLKWERILPDARDYANLGWLPVRPRTILAANVVAIAAAAVVVNLAINAFSSLLFPLFVVAADPSGSVGMGEFAAAHAVTMSLASLFALLLVLATMGAATGVFQGRTADRASMVVRVALLAGFILLVPAAVNLGPAVRSIPGAAAKLEWFAPVWFLGLYQQLQGRGPAAVASLASLVWQSITALLALATIACGLSYRRRYRAVAETVPQDGRVSVDRLIFGALDLITPRGGGLDRAIANFTIRGLLRTDSQRLLLFATLGLGWLIALQAVGTFRAAPLIPAYLLVAALQIGFHLPATLPANWIFRLLLVRSRTSASDAAMRVVFTLVVLFIFLPASVVYLKIHDGLGATLLTLLCLLSVSTLHIQIAFRRAARIPFTCAFPPFRQDFPVKCLLHAVGFAVFVSLGSKANAWVLAHPPGILFVLALPVAMWLWNRTRYMKARSSEDPDLCIQFEHFDHGSLQLTNLTSAPVKKA